MKKLTYSFVLLITYTLFATGCGEKKEDDLVLPTVYVQLNNFSDANVIFWTTDKATQTLVSQNEQYARQEGTMKVTPGVEYHKTIYLKKVGSPNAFNAQANYIVKAQNTTTTEITIIFTWDGTNLIQE